MSVHARDSWDEKPVGLLLRAGGFWCGPLAAPTGFRKKESAPAASSTKYKEPKLVSELAGYLISGTDQIGEAILGDLVRIHPMASERGRNALLNSAAYRADIVTRFGELENDEERALWLLMAHADIFREGEELRFFDYYSEGSRGRNYRNNANLTLSRAEVDLGAFKEDICQFHRRRDGSGVSCEIEFAEHHQDHSVIMRPGAARKLSEVRETIAAIRRVELKTGDTTTLSRRIQHLLHDFVVQVPIIDGQVCALLDILIRACKAASKSARMLRAPAGAGSQARAAYFDPFYLRSFKRRPHSWS